MINRADPFIFRKLWRSWGIQSIKMVKSKNELKGEDR